MADTEEALPGPIVHGESPSNHTTKLAPYEKIEEAMLLASGDRLVAAQQLGLTVKQLNNRIKNNHFLQARWSYRAVKTRLKEDAAKDLRLKKEREEEQNEPSFRLQKNIDEQMVNLVEFQRTLTKRARMVESRIERGELAITDPKHPSALPFSNNVKGDPAEEAMLRETLSELYEKIIHISEIITSGQVSKAKISSILSKKRGGRGGFVGSSRGTGFLPKGVGAKTIVDARGAQVLIQNGVAGNSPTKQPGESGAGGAQLAGVEPGATGDTASGS